MDNRVYTEEEKCSPWEYGCSIETSASESEWEDSNKPILIPESMKRPGRSILRDLEVSTSSSSLDEYCTRMRETFRIERLEESSIDYIITTTKKFLEYVSRNIDDFPENNGINHQVIELAILELIFFLDGDQICECLI